MITLFSSRLFLLASLLLATATHSNPDPTLRPTPSPTSLHFMIYDNADMVYATIHNDANCNSTIVGFSIKAYVLNQCMPSNDAARQYKPYIRKCFIGAKRISIVQDSYTDFACTQPSPKGSFADSVIYHGDVCSRRERNLPGQSSRALCTLLPESLAFRDMIVVQSFVNSGCSGAPTAAGLNPEITALFLNTCSFFFDAGRTRRYRILTYVSGDGYASDLVLLETRYAFSDKHCRQPSLGQFHVVYKKSDGTGACLPDPLLPKRFYFNVLRTTNLMQTAPDWAILPNWAAPTPAPTPAPTAPSPAPSIFIDPTAIWFARLSAAGTGASALVIAAHSTFYNALKAQGLLSKITRLNTFAGNDATAAFIPFIQGGGPNADTPYTSASSGIPASIWSFGYSQTRGLTSPTGQMLYTGQRISRINQTDTSSAFSDGSTVHMGMYFLDTPTANGRLMGVFRHAVYVRHYLLSDGYNTWGFGNPTSSSPITSGLAVITATTTGASRYICAKGTGSSCSASLHANPDRSVPADWPVGVFGCFGSMTGVISESIEPYGLVPDVRSAGYTIGYPLSAADVEALSSAWRQLNMDLGRT